jgi:hypothetical protein
LIQKLEKYKYYELGSRHVISIRTDYNLGEGYGRNNHVQGFHKNGFDVRKGELKWL